MKKTLYSIAALSLAFFASCAEESFNAAPQMGDAITFQINEDLVTRGTPITKKNIVSEMGTMNVVVRDDNGENPFSDDNTTLTLSGGESGLTGSISPNRYWSANMGADDQYHFFVAPQGFNLNPSYANGAFTFTYTQPNNYESDGVDGKDLIVAASSAKKGEQVCVTFRHALTAVKVIYDKPINAHDISSITVWDAIASASCTYDGETFNWNTTGAKTTNLTQNVNHQIVSSEGELLGTEESTFMLIPGSKLNLSVEIDGKDYYLTEDTDIDLVAGQTVVINITDEAKKTEGSGSNKVITYDEDTDTYSITIDAWVTGEVKTETKSVPLDIVVLMDVSGSMDDDFDGKSTWTESKKRIYAAKQAFTNLVNTVKQNGENNNVTHRISLVKFADDSFYNNNVNSVGNHRKSTWLFVEIPNSGANYSEIVTPFTELSGNNDNTLINAANNLVADGTTAVDYGLDCVQAVFNNYPRTDGTNASKVVIMLTDGAPTHGSSFDQDVANDAIAKSKTLKDNNTTVWSVYIGNKPSDQVNSYMTSVATDADHYKYASDETALNNIFATISSSIGGATAELGTETTISDAMSSVFTLPAGLTQSNVKDYVKCYEIDFAGYNGKTALWDENSSNDITAGMTITVNDNTFEVKGFDFTTNYCAVDSSTKEPRGKKLQIVISGLKYNGEGDLTNMAGSGIYDAQGNLVNEFTPAPLQ